MGTKSKINYMIIVFSSTLTKVDAKGIFNTKSHHT